MTRSKDFQELSLMMAGRKCHTHTLGWRWFVCGFVLATVTLYIIWNGLRDSHTGDSPKRTIKTAPSAYTSLGRPVLSPRCCSGDWKPGLPANMVFVPILVADIICDNPKSPYMPSRTHLIPGFIYQGHFKTHSTIHIVLPGCWKV